MVNKLCIFWPEELWYYRNGRCYNKNHNSNSFMFRSDWWALPLKVLQLPCTYVWINARVYAAIMNGFLQTAFKSPSYNFRSSYTSFSISLISCILFFCFFFFVYMTSSINLCISNSMISTENRIFYIRREELRTS
jgi:hypothetical protein